MTGQTSPQPRTCVYFAFAIGNENKGYKTRSEILFSSIRLTLMYKTDICTSIALDQGELGDRGTRIAVVGQTKRHVARFLSPVPQEERGSDAVAVPSTHPASRSAAQGLPKPKLRVVFLLLAFFSPSPFFQCPLMCAFSPGSYCANCCVSRHPVTRSPTGNHLFMYLQTLLLNNAADKPHSSLRSRDVHLQHLWKRCLPD